MKKSMLYSQVALATCIWFIGSSAMAKPWWQNPVIKSSEDTGVGGNADPHYMNKDESDQYLFVALASANTAIPGQLFSIPALISGVSSADITPIASGTPADLYGNWKGGAVSDDLKRILSGNGSPLAVTVNASLPLTAPWTKDVTVFAITNSPSDWGCDGIDFSHTSEFLFSNIYNSGSRNKIVKWNVVNLNSAGLALTANTVFTTSLSRIRNVSDYYIGGKDLVYYGEGNDTLGMVPKNVCVYDPALGTETVLLTQTRPGVAGVDTDIMNVKVGGVGLGQMHLYVQDNDGTLFIYELNADGKSVGALVKSFSSAEMKTLLGDFTRIRNLEFTNDEKYAFFIHAPLTGNALLHTVWTKPVETAWWRAPYVKYTEDVATGGPHYLNKDESDQYLFLQSQPATTTPGYLYSIPALIAASSASAVAPIATDLPQNFYGTWKCGAISDDLLRVLTGSGAPAGGDTMVNASLPLTAPWTKDVNVFAITNDPTTVQFDGADFSHTSQFLYSDSYLSPRTRIIQWNVVNLTSGGTGLTANNIFTTTIKRVRNVSDYYIGGKDLVYYGEGDAATATDSKVCVYDPAAGTETVLITGLPKGNAAYDIMNVKVGGIGRGQMHLYVQCDGGALSVYELGADGKSVGALVRSFSTAQMYSLLGSLPSSNMRCFEVTDDEQFAFITFHGASGLYVITGWPVGTVMKAY